MSAVARTETAIACTPSDGAAASTERMKNLDWGEVSGLNMTATRARPGAAALSKSTHLPPIENSYMLKPVRLPPASPRLQRTLAQPGRRPARTRLGRYSWLAG